MKKMWIAVLAGLIAAVIIGTAVVMLMGPSIALRNVGRPSGYGSIAIGNLRTILGAENACFEARGVYGTFEMLTKGPRSWMANGTA